MGNRLLRSLVLFAFVAAFSYAETNRPSQIDWLDEYGQAQQQRQTEKRPMLVFVKSDGCVYCEKMMRTTYSNDKVIHNVSTKYIPTFVNAAKNAELANSFGVRIYPTTIVVSPENLIVGRIEGFVNADQLLKSLSTIHAKLELAERKNDSAR